jgi:DedD protein
VNDILKQRLVGALVLIGLGVIFWPMVFVESERSGLDRDTQIEPMPAMDHVVIPAPRPLEDVEPVRSARHAVLPDEPAGVNLEAEAVTQAPDPAAEAREEASEEGPRPESAGTEPELDAEGIPVAWVLQVASVSSRDKADELTATLISQDYKAYHRAIRRNGEVLYRVFIGPVFERDKLVAIKRKIDQQLKVSAIIARYVP